jgi:hypothetical protein
MARFFVAWTVFVVHSRKLRQHRTRSVHRLMKRCFFLWKGCADHDRNLVLEVRERAMQRYLRKILDEWHNKIVCCTQTLPTNFYAKTRLRMYFDEWRTHKAYVAVSEIIVPNILLQRTKKAFLLWASRHERRKKYRTGSFLFSVLYYELKKRMIFRNWPGRAEWRKSEAMREVFALRGRGRIALVDVSGPQNGAGKSTLLISSSSSRKSALSKKGAATPLITHTQPSITQRALRFGYLQSVYDVLGVQSLVSLLRAVLQAWKRIALYIIDLRIRGRRLQVLNEQRLLLVGLRHWIALTPCTAHRILSWINKRYVRPHDDYMYNLAALDRYEADKQDAEMLDEDVLRRIRSNKVANYTKAIVAAATDVGFQRSHF